MTTVADAEAPLEPQNKATTDADASMTKNRIEQSFLLIRLLPSVVVAMAMIMVLECVGY